MPQSNRPTFRVRSVGGTFQVFPKDAEIKYWQSRRNQYTLIVRYSMVRTQFDVYGETFNELKKRGACLVRA